MAIRINALDTEWGLGDVEACAACGAHALLPKVESAIMVVAAAEAMEPGRRPIWRCNA